MTTRVQKLKVGYVLSYKYPTYVRTRYILQLLDKSPNTQVIQAINSNKGIWRYVQTIWRLIIMRITERPDVYILGFRGAEIYWPVRLITIGKPLVYDEFLSPYLWAVEEHKKLTPNWLFAPLIYMYVKLTLLTADAVLSDTDLHARYSYEKFKIDPSKFTTLYVGTDERVFDKSQIKIRKEKNMFNVFFYGNFLPLHGVHIIVQAAEKLKDKHITFTIVGGANRKKDMKRFKDYIEEKKLTNIVHFEWVDFHKLPEYMGAADLCLGGPFGGTPQALKVVTGKTYQLLSIARPVIVGKIDEDVGFVDKQNCLMVDQNSSTSLAEAIGWGYDNREKLDDIGKRGEQLYREKFSQDAQLKKLISVISRVSGADPRSTD